MRACRPETRLCSSLLKRLRSWAKRRSSAGSTLALAMPGSYHRLLDRDHVRYAVHPRRTAMTSRRDVLKLGAWSVATSTLAPSLLRGAADANDEFGGLPMGIQSYSLRKMSL